MPCASRARTLMLINVSYQVYITEAFFFYYANWRWSITKTIMRTSRNVIGQWTQSKPTTNQSEWFFHTQLWETHRSSGIWQRPWMTISSMPQEQSFWRKVPRSSRGKRAAHLLADSFWEDSLLYISREKQADIRMKTKEQLQKQSPASSMASEFSIHKLNCTIRHLKNTKSPGKDGISNEIILHLGMWLNRNCWTNTTSPGTQGHFQPAGKRP